MRLAQFITGNLEQILVEWEAFAASLLAPGHVMTPRAAPLNAARRINFSAAKMDAMINDLLEYTRTRLGREIPVSLEPASMEQICRIAFDEIRAAYPERIFQLETSGELEGRFDSARLQQVLSNLLNNAVQHGNASLPITLSAHGEPDRITLSVKNYGEPIPAGQLQVIFNSLVQIPSPAAALHSGGSPSTSLGLGLYIAREIVAMHGGTIVAESSDRDGTVFSARLPRRASGARA